MEEQEKNNGINISEFLKEKVRDSDDIREWMTPQGDTEEIWKEFCFLREAEKKKVQAIGIGLGYKDLYRLRKQYKEGKQLAQGDPAEELRSGVEEFASRYFDPLTPREVGGILNEIGEQTISIANSFDELEENQRGNKGRCVRPVVTKEERENHYGNALKKVSFCLDMLEKLEVNRCIDDNWFSQKWGDYLTHEEIVGALLSAEQELKPYNKDEENI
jgi:hypothetical protein